MGEGAASQNTDSPHLNIGYKDFSDFSLEIGAMLVLQSGGCKLRTDHISLILTPQLWPPPALPWQCNNYLSGGYQHQH